MIQKRCCQKFLVITLLVLLTIFFSTNSYSVMWEKSFGGSFDDIGFSVQQTADGGYIIAGHTESSGAGSADAYLIKTDASGNLVWERTFGGIGLDIGFSVQQTADGGYIIAGYTYSYGAGGSDVYLIKTDGSGNLVWEKTFGGISSDFARSVQQTTDGGFIIAGDTYSPFAPSFSYDVYLIKTDGSGNLVWENTFTRGVAEDRGFSVQQTVDGGYIIAGYTKSSSAGGSDVYLIKTDGSGILVWENTFGGSGVDVGFSAQQTVDGGYITAGYTESSGAGGSDVYLFYIDEDTALTKVQMQVTSSSVAEEVGGASHTVTVQLNTTSTLDSAVTVDVVDLLTGSATKGADNDYTYNTPTSVTFPIGSVDGATQTVTLDILDDTLVEDDETINLQLQNVTGPATILAGSENHQVTISDNDVWETVYNTLPDSPSYLNLLRRYRDEVLSNTTKGIIYKTLLYSLSKQALQVLFSNPNFIYQAKALIEPNYGAVLDVLDGYKGIIYNTDEIAVFLDAYAKKSPLILKIFSYIVRWDMLRKQKQGDLFFGFRLK